MNCTTFNLDIIHKINNFEPKLNILIFREKKITKSNTVPLSITKAKQVVATIIMIRCIVHLPFLVPNSHTPAYFRPGLGIKRCLASYTNTALHFILCLNKASTLLQYLCN